MHSIAYSRLKLALYLCTAVPCQNKFAGFFCSLYLCNSVLGNLFRNEISSLPLYCCTWPEKIGHFFELVVVIHLPKFISPMWVVQIFFCFQKIGVSAVFATVKIFLFSILCTLPCPLVDLLKGQNIYQKCMA